MSLLNLLRGKSKKTIRDNGLLVDYEIRELCEKHELITPFTDQSPHGKVSYGLSHCGYDLRCSDQWGVPKDDQILDVKSMCHDAFEWVQAPFWVIPAHSFVLCRSLEYIKMLKNTAALAWGKSTYARCGVVANVTPLEPEWEGELTIELSNTTNCPVKIYAFEGIVQIVFFAIPTPAVTYKDKKGKYQGQRGVTIAKVSS